MLGLAWAMTLPPRARQASIAAGITLTSMPRLTTPCRGIEVCSRTTSGGIARENSAGTRLSRQGT